MNELNDVIEANRRARKTTEAPRTRNRQSNKDAFVAREYSDLPTRAELKRMKRPANGSASNRRRHA